ncbi:hypothetical protein M3J09_003480 [Ascochyta lentis]
MSILKSILQVLLLALVAPYLYDRYTFLSTMIANRPGKLQNIKSFESYGVKYQDRLRNCEDVILEESLGVAFLSCDPGRDRWNTVMGSFQPEKGSSDHGGLWIYDYASPNLSDTDRLKQLDVDEQDLHPLGIAFDASTSTLYVVNHSRHSKSHILILNIDMQTLTTTLVARLQHDLLHAPNSIEIIDKNELYITNDHYLRSATSPLLSKIETFSGAPGGSIVYINTRSPSSAKIVGRVPFANGITLLNSTTVAVSSSSKYGVYLFSISAEKSLLFQRIITVPAAPDNLSRDSRGALLVAGHPFAPALMGVAQSRAECRVTGVGADCNCTAPSWVGEWSEAGGLKTLYRDDGGEFCSSTTVVRDLERGVGIVSGLYERGVLVFRT